MSAITAVCKKDHFPAYRQSGSRPETSIIWIVIHDTESGADTAESVAKYFKSHSAGGSAHLVVDGKDCFRCLPNTAIPWGAPGANSKGFHIELCAKASWTRAEWLKNDALLERAAYKTAIHCKKFDIPVRFRTSKGLKKGYAGITTHAECTKAFGGDHTDPGANFPMDVFVKKVKAHFDAL